MINKASVNEVLIQRIACAKLPSGYGEFDMAAYNSSVDCSTQLAIFKGDISSGDPVLVRIHSECMTGDVFASKRCDCGQQLQLALRMIEQNGCGVLLYLRQEGRGIGLDNKIRAYELQERGFDSVDANLELGFAEDARDYAIGAQMLLDLGVKKVRLLTNNPKKIAGLVENGLDVVETLSIQASSCRENIRYLRTKKDRMGHCLNID